MSGKIGIKEIDITRISADCIVNAANERLEPDDSVSGAIFRAAGPEMNKACRSIGHCDPGKAVITAAFNLNAEYVVHAVGPVYIDGRHGEPELLYSCYREALNLARQNAVHSIAFPVVASGILGYPKEDAWRIGLTAIRDDQKENPDYRLDVYFSVIDSEMDRLGEKIMAEKPTTLTEIIANGARRDLKEARKEEKGNKEEKDSKKSEKSKNEKEDHSGKNSGREDRNGKEDKPVFFWHAGMKYGEFSLRFETSFEVEGIIYNNVEQYLQAKKALLFNDLYHYAQIMNEQNPEACKALGREVPGFIQGQWDKFRPELLYNANYAKFSQNPELRESLLGTGNRPIAETSPYNDDYGIGMDEKEAKGRKPDEWKGKNLLGKSLMKVREALRQ